MADFTIGPATTPQDLGEVQKLCWAYRDFLLNNSAIDQEITETFYPVPKYKALMDDLPQIHARPKGIILLALDPNGKPLGCGMTHALDDQISEIKRVFVNKSARGQGVAVALCEALISQAQNDGFDCIVLDTSKTLIAAQKLYEGLGFHPRGPYQPIPEDILPELLFYERKLS